MPSAAINQVNQTELAEAQCYLLIFYDCKDNHVWDDDTNIAGVDKAPEITVVDEEINEDPQDKYENTDVDIKHDEHQYNHEHHEEDHNANEHNNVNLDLRKDDNHDDLQEQDMGPIG